MCIFTGPSNVSGTSIFGRVDGAEQLLVYQMAFDAPSDVAMVLPLPIAAGHGDAAVRFIDLSTYPWFFEALELMFPHEMELLDLGAVASRSQGIIAVQRVGDFEASYVPSVADFGRLDKRFQLSSVVWDSLPAYRDFGFAVFKLFQPKRGLLERIGIKKAEPVESAKPLHPMALAFRTRTPERVFFPTVHVHDGAVHADADFDHELYCQLAQAPVGWERSEQPVDRWALDAAKGLLVDAVVYRTSMHGSFKNSDVHAAGKV